MSNTISPATATGLFSVRLDADLLHPHHILLARAVHLPPADQSLLRLALEGRTFRDLSLIFERPPGTLCRHVQRLTARLRHPVVAAICDFPADLPETYRRVGIGRFLLRHPLRQLAAEHRLPLYEVRAILGYLNTFANLLRPAHAAEPQARPSRCKLAV